MKKLDEFEDKINGALISKYDELKQSSINFYERLKKWSLQKFVDYYNKVLPVYTFAKNNFISITQTNPRDLINDIKNALKMITWKNTVKVLRYPPYEKIGIFIKRNSVAIFFALIFTVGALKTLQSISKFFDKDKGRNLASEEKVISRPEYYLLGKRLLKIENLQIPVSLSKNKRIETVLADIVIECPTRTSQKFLYNATHLIYDKLTNTIAPQIGSFPLTEEGKSILKHKIRFEISQLLKENHFENHKVQNVNIIQVTSS